VVLPIVYADTPVQGSISWDAFHIAYEGAAYDVSAGNTPDRWVWWRYNGGVSPAIETGPEIPEDMTEDDLVILSNRNGVPVRILAATLIDGELIVDGSVFAKSIASNTITAEEIKAKTLTGDLFASSVVLGATISTGVQDDEGNIVGARVELGPAGLMSYDSAGIPVVSLPLSGEEEALIRAHLDILSAEVQGNFTLHGTNNTVAKDAVLSLSQGVDAPTAPPGISYTYDTVQLDTTTAVGPNAPSFGNLGTFALNASQITSIVWDAEWSCWVVGEQKSGGLRIWRFGANGAIYNNLFTGRPWIDDYVNYAEARVGPRAAGNEGIAILFRSGTDYYLAGDTPEGAGVINKIPASWIRHDDQTPGIGFDADSNRYLLVQNNGGGAGTLEVRRFYLQTGSGFPTALNTSTTQGPAGSAVVQPVNGVVYGNQVTGSSTRLAIAHETYLTVESYDSTLAPKNVDGAYEWWTAPTAHKGFAHNGAQFVTVDATGKITKYESWNWPEASALAKVGASLYDSDPAGDPANPHPGQAAGTHETPVGSVYEFQQRRRAKLVITMPATPDGGLADDPDKWRLYYSRKATASAAADYKLIDSIGDPNARTTKIISADPTGAAPPGGLANTPGAVNNFPLANPARLTSTALAADGSPAIDLRGDGKWRLDASKNLDDTGWVTGWATKGASTAFPDTSATTINYAGYRRVGNQVQVDFNVTSGGAWNPTAADHANQAVLNDLPVEVRPLRNTPMNVRMQDQPVSVVLTPGGNITWTGSPRANPTFAVTQVMEGSVTYFI
jgi:hypothetical protein